MPQSLGRGERRQRPAAVRRHDDRHGHLCALVAGQARLVAAALLDRDEAEPLILVFVICLLVRFKGWRTIACVVLMLVALATLPIVPATHGDLPGGFVATHPGLAVFATLVTGAMPMRSVFAVIAVSVRSSAPGAAASTFAAGIRAANKS